MLIELVLPALVTAMAAVALMIWRHHLSPQLTARCVTAVTVIAALAFIWSELTVLIGSLGQVPAVAGWLGWCEDHYRPGELVPPLAGLVAGVGLVVGLCRLVRAIRRERQALRNLPAGTDPVHLVESTRVFAYAAPGRPNRVVVSRGMLDTLSPPEQAVLFAHEESHLANHHHWFRVAAALAASTLPPLRRLADEVTYATERWADEDAVRTVGDRMLVATAISRAAVATTEQPAFSPMTGSDTLARVEAVLEPQVGAPLRSLPGAAMTTALAVALAGSAVQLHHLVEFLLHVCAD